MSRICLHKILIVDDKKENLFTLKKVLADLEVEFVQATRGNDALKATLHNDFALALLDVQMPEMDGYELAELLRCDAATANLPIIFLSAVYHDNYHVFKGYESGAVDFITKPYEPKILLSKIKFFLQLHSQKIALQKAVELEQAKSYLESILFSMTDAVFVTDPAGKITTCNQGGLSLVGFAQGEMTGRALHELLGDALCSEWLDQLAFGSRPESLRNQEAILQTASDAAIPVLVSASPICPESEDEPGKLRGAVFVLRDIRDRKKMEERIYRAERMESIGLLAGGVAHDLNNILAGIIGYPELMLKTLSEDSPLREPIEAVLQSGQRAAMVVADLLTVARGVAMSREVRNLNRLVREYLASPECRQLQSLYPGITCKQQLAAKQADIFCSPIHIKKCLMNLVTNAAEAIDAEGTITVSTQNEQVDKDIDAEGPEEHVLGKGKYIVLRVEDTGSGIAEEDMQHIFEPFYTRKVMGRSGTGLGLAVVWNTVKDHDGRIFVTSSETGTCFQVYFPLSTEKSAGSGEDCQQEIVPSGSGAAVLIIDDEPQLRDVAARMLQTLGYIADSVCSGEMAIKYLMENQVDLVVIDMQMEPGMNGYETYQEILYIRADQKALIVSGFSDNENVQAALDLGADGFIKKPYSMEQLGRAVREALEI
ncbi:MAG: response regulator [Candidatus Electrothrix sp. YB6]